MPATCPACDKAIHESDWFCPSCWTQLTPACAATWKPTGHVALSTSEHHDTRTAAVDDFHPLPLPERARHAGRGKTWLGRRLVWYALVTPRLLVGLGVLFSIETPFGGGAVSNAPSADLTTGLNIGAVVKIGIDRARLSANGTSVSTAIIVPATSVTLEGIDDVSNSGDPTVRRLPLDSMTVVW